MSDWKDRIKQWAADRNLIEGSTTGKQMDKLCEEVDELREGLLNQNIDDIKDAIGDIQVVLAVMCAQLGLDIDECREIAWEQINQGPQRANGRRRVREGGYTVTDIELIEADLKSIDDARRCLESMKSIHKDRDLPRDFEMVWADLQILAGRLQRKLDRLKNEGGAK